MALLTLQLLSPPEDLLHTRTAKNRAAWGHRAQGTGGRGSENQARGKGRATGGRACGRSRVTLADGAAGFRFLLPLAPPAMQER